MLIRQIPVEVMYKKDNGQFVVDLKEYLTAEEYSFSEQVAVVIPPSVIGGNHKHKRIEGFIALHKSLHIYWLEPDGTRHSMQLVGEDEQLYLTLVPSMVPHAVKNTDKEQHAVLIEYASEKSSSVERITVIGA